MQEACQLGKITSMNVSLLLFSHVCFNERRPSMAASLFLCHTYVEAVRDLESVLLDIYSSSSYWHLKMSITWLRQPPIGVFQSSIIQLAGLKQTMKVPQSCRKHPEEVPWSCTFKPGRVILFKLLAGVSTGIPSAFTRGVEALTHGNGVAHSLVVTNPRSSGNSQIYYYFFFFQCKILSTTPIIFPGGVELFVTVLWEGDPITPPAALLLI